MIAGTPLVDPREPPRRSLTGWRSEGEREGEGEDSGKRTSDEVG